MPRILLPRGAEKKLPVAKVRAKKAEPVAKERWLGMDCYQEGNVVRRVAINWLIHKTATQTPLWPQTQTWPREGSPPSCYVQRSPETPLPSLVPSPGDPQHQGQEKRAGHNFAYSCRRDVDLRNLQPWNQGWRTPVRGGEALCPLWVL